MYLNEIQTRKETKKDMNKNRLKSLIMLYDGTQKNLAQAIGISQSRLNAKINEKNAEFTQKEIKMIADRYGLSASDISEIFFDNSVSNLDTNAAG